MFVEESLYRACNSKLSSSTGKIQNLFFIINELITTQHVSFYFLQSQCQIKIRQCDIFTFEVAKVPVTIGVTLSAEMAFVETSER